MRETLRWHVFVAYRFARKDLQPLSWQAGDECGFVFLSFLMVDVSAGFGNTPCCYGFLAWAAMRLGVTTATDNGLSATTRRHCDSVHDSFSYRERPSRPP